MLQAWNVVRTPGGPAILSLQAARSNRRFPVISAHKSRVHAQKALARLRTLEDQPKAQTPPLWPDYRSPRT